MSDVLRAAALTIVHEADKVLGEDDYRNLDGPEQRIMGWIAGAVQRRGVRTCPDFQAALVGGTACFILLPIAGAGCIDHLAPVYPLLEPILRAPKEPTCDWCSLAVRETGDLTEMTISKSNLAVSGWACDGCQLLATELLEALRDGLY